MINLLVALSLRIPPSHAFPNARGGLTPSRTGNNFKPALHAVTTEVEVVRRGPRSSDSAGTQQPSPRFAHSAVPVPSSFGSYATVRLLGSHSHPFFTALPCFEPLYTCWAKSFIHRALLSCVCAIPAVPALGSFASLLSSHRLQSPSSRPFDCGVVGLTVACLTVQEMVVFGGVNPGQDLSDLAILRCGGEESTVAPCEEEGVVIEELHDDGTEGHKLKTQSTTIQHKEGLVELKISEAP